MFKQLIFALLLIPFLMTAQIASEASYLSEVKAEMQKKWPQNRTVNIVFHGHSVPSGYFTGGIVHRTDNYPACTLKALNDKYPYSVINCITTSIGGERATQGCKRVKKDVLPHQPDVVFIDYALNDRAWKGQTQEEALVNAKKAWIKMVKQLQKHGIEVVLMTPTPDIKENILDNNTQLALHAAQIREIADEYHVGLVDSYQFFKDMAQEGKDLKYYMAQNNHINEKGHELVATEIVKWF